ncbi:MAG: citramalate synthase [Chloroflexi bacterium]|nr:citramalate synthase [Chloroflexota bacterium]
MNYKVELYDTTLRDGTQQEGISLSVEDKLAITERLDQLGIDVIEGGFAGANPKDDEYFRRVQSLDLKHAQIAAFGNTRRANGDAASDLTLKALLDTNAPVLTLVGKSSEYQVRVVLQTSLEENLAMIADSVRYLKARDRRVFFDAEHFFDGYKLDRDYALQTLRVALDAGADRIVLCDTNGGTLPAEIARIVSEVKGSLGDTAVLGIHSHNDTDTAVASAIAAIEAGATHVQGCINGYGERTGNANMISIIGNLNLKMGVQVISDEQLSTLTEVSNFVSERVNRRPFPFQPFVGSSAFAHKGGLHAAATEKSAGAYQHIEPSVVGNANDVVVSELSGRGNVMRRIRDMGLEAELDDADARRIVQHVKEQEAKGFSYEGAHASFDLVLRRALPNYEAPYELVDFMVIVENRRRSSFGTGWRKDGAEHPMLSEATVKVRIGDEVQHTAAEGDGPVGALDQALRKALTSAYPEISAVRLTDYKVRVVNEGAGTGAVVRVVIESADDRDVWHTVGASSNILEASWLALTDSFEWWLLKNEVKPKA